MELLLRSIANGYFNRVTLFIILGQGTNSETTTVYTNPICWENRDSLTPEQVETLRLKLKWLNKKIRLYNARMRTFCLENLEFRSIFKHCREWQKTKLALYHQMMKLYYGRDPRLSSIH